MSEQDNFPMRLVGQNEEASSRSRAGHCHSGHGPGTKTVLTLFTGNMSIKQNRLQEFSHV